jgi:hypothetical protein
MMKPYVGLMQKFAPQTLARQPEMDVVMYDREQDEQFTRDGQEGSLAVLYQLIVEALLRLAPQGGRALDIVFVVRVGYGDPPRFRQGRRELEDLLLDPA